MQLADMVSCRARVAVYTDIGLILKDAMTASFAGWIGWIIGLSQTWNSLYECSVDQSVNAAEKLTAAAWEIDSLAPVA